MPNPNTLEKIMAEIAECTKRRSRLILSQLDMAFPQGQPRSLVRSAVLNSLGDSGLLLEVRGILTANQRTLVGAGVDNAQ